MTTSDKPGFSDGAQTAYDAHARFGVAARAPKARPELFRKTTIAEFEAFLKTVDETERFEWIRGQIVQQQAGQTRRHSNLALRTLQLLSNQLDPAKWAVRLEFGVWTGESYRYADLIVEPTGADDEERASDAPVIIVEVLSRTSEARDQIDKTTDYLKIPSLHAYVMLGQFSRTCEAYVRDAGGEFPAEPAAHADGGTIRIGALGVELSVDDIYDGILDRDDPSTA